MGADHCRSAPLVCRGAGNRLASIHPSVFTEDQAEGVTDGIAKDICG